MLLDTDPDPLPRDAVSDWESIDLGDGPDSVDLVVETANMLSIMVAQQLERVDALRREALAQARIRGVRSPEIAERSLRLEVASALRCSEYAAGELIARAQALVHRFPQMLESLSRAQTTDRHTKLFVEAMAAVEPEFHDRIVPRAVALAEVEPVGTFRRSLRRLIEAVRAETLAARHEAALVGRRVVIEDADDGMAWLVLYAPAVEVHAIRARLTTMAKAITASPDESRTLDQLRADIAGDLLVDGDTTHLAPEARGIRATVAVTVPVLALLGDADASLGGSAMGEGLGPVPIDRARDLCGGADGWMRVLTHPETGAVVSVGRDRYRPPPELRTLVKWRADRCMAPGCGMPASRCEIDHTVAWEDGGITALENLAPICKGHHTVKHHGGWLVSQVAGSGGALEWISPTGRRYRVEPERRTPVFESAQDTGRGLTRDAGPAPTRVFGPTRSDVAPF